MEVDGLMNCWWCNYTIDETCETPVYMDEWEVGSKFCNGNCAMSFFTTHRSKDILPCDAERMIQVALEYPDDATWKCAPEAQGQYNWWGGVLTREDFLRHCQTFFINAMIPDKPDHEYQIQYNGTLEGICLSSQPLTFAIRAKNKKK
jgi:hypothetical protein